jgi:hypothetical protein
VLGILRLDQVVVVVSRRNGLVGRAHSGLAGCDELAELRNARGRT